MKIILVNPEVRLQYSHSRKGMYPPLGLLSLATRLRLDYGDDVQLQLLDGDIQEVDGSMFSGADLVGFHANSFNYENGLDLAREAKDSGAVVVLGGPHASVLWPDIMKNRDFIDYIVVQEGELTFSKLIGRMMGRNKEELSSIPNLVFRMPDGTAVKSDVDYVNTPSDMITPDRDFLDAEEYIRNYRLLYTKEQSPMERPMSIYSSKGCTWRDKSGGCVFCARLERGVRFRAIDEIWGEIVQLKKDYGTEFIWDISDDNLNRPEWFKDFVNRRPDGLEEVSFLVYSRVNRIKDDIIPYLKKLNVYEVYLGIESGDDQMLKSTNKGASSRLALDAARRLKEADLRYFPSFVLGLPGESEGSLKNTLTFSEELAKIGSIYRMSATILMPIPGSQVWEMLVKHPETGKLIHGRDIVDIASLERVWINHFTDMNYETAQKYQARINAVIGEASKSESFGLNLNKDKSAEGGD